MTNPASSSVGPTTTAQPQTVAPSTDPLTFLKHRLDRLDSHIKFEFELTAQRITYVTTSEAFLFSAYALGLAHYKSSNAYTEVIKRLVGALPYIGVALGTAVLFAVAGAISMIFKLKTERAALNTKAEEAGLGVHRDVGSTSWEHFIGLLPPVVVPIAFIGAWLYIWPS